ncbi:MAG: DNA polymerase III subunit alpha [Candidatus Pacebacteria bacterium]|nr:DNA polymerase III subunit alpha [Candidatus Paceibacterota bacterium]
MKFTHLHVHSHYSLLDGLPKIDQLLDYTKELGMESLALTDHGVLYGAVEFFKKAKKRGIKPIIGSELYLAYEKMHQRRPHIDDKKYHLVLLVKNETGYKNLVKLITKAHLEGFYYKPRIDEDLLFENCKGLIALSGCIQGKIPRLIIANKFDEAKLLAQKYNYYFGEGNFYLEIQDHPNLEEQKKANKGLIEIAKKYKIPLVATNDAHYLKPEDAKVQDILMLINTGAKPDDPERLTMIQDDFSLRPPEQMFESFKDLPEAIENTQRIVEECNFEFNLQKTKLPHFPLPDGKTPDDSLRELCLFGVKERKLKLKGEVRDRLNYELEVINKMGFAPYFLIVADVVNWTKKNGIIVGPGRGSVGSSLVAYLLGITNINPLKYNLLFERFLNPERISMPDIDLDFADTRRDEVIEYVSQKYGRDHVAQIITFGTMAARAVVRDVGRVLQYPYSFCDKIAKLIPFGFSLEEALSKIDQLRQMYIGDERVQKLIDFSKKLEGVARHASTHACGVVISPDPLSEIVPLQHPTQDDQSIVTQYEMHSIEDLGLLKMDFLGLKNLTIIENTIKLVKKTQNKQIEIDKISFDDKKTYKLLQRGETTCVFQLESSGMKRYLRQLKPTKFEDIVTMLALYRPGPMQFIPEYVERKRGKKRIEYLHPKLKPILQNTCGFPVFQEQIMQIAQAIAGFSLAEADILRKAIGKKIASLLKEQKEKFIKGAIENGIKEEIAQKIWSWFLPFARYGFNRSHSVGYGIVAYITAYLKAHFPVEFMAAVLASEKQDVERIAFLLEECKRMGIEVLPPDVNESFENFTVVGRNKIRFGLLAIKNVGHNLVEAIVKERIKNGKYQSIADFLSRIDAKDLNKKSMEALIKAGAFEKLEERNKLLKNLERILEYARKMQKAKLNGQQGLFDNLSHTKTIYLEPAKEAMLKEKLLWEKELLGLYVSGHPLKPLENILKKKAVPIAKIRESISKETTSFVFIQKIMPGTKIRIAGLINKIKRIVTRNGKPMLFVEVEDLSEKIETIVFPGVIEKNPTALQENKIVFISGRLDFADEVPKIIAEEIEELIEE